ncbi:hypothetical protein E2C01_001264 [Portunus trituberculatus]|uniref:Uncharacterized protein n=1 Tax=Portunus trituberculatus TaxID=210409 RepID=A0A5B7CIV8_PORTR|nr:hypothetical protein [Portunus trituberculatus]
MEIWRQDTMSPAQSLYNKTRFSVVSDDLSGLLAHSLFLTAQGTTKTYLLVLGKRVESGDRPSSKLIGTCWLSFLRSDPNFESLVSQHSDTLQPTQHCRAVRHQICKLKLRKTKNNRGLHYTAFLP